MRYLSAHKNRQEQDQSNNTSVGGFDAILDTYKDPSLTIERPPEMDLENVDPSKSINPHSVGAPGLEDDAQWLENVWTEYVRPKYKLIMQKWYKDTGGGARTLENFSNYCKLKDGNYPWMLWV